jgi:hypothetical protein
MLRTGGRHAHEIEYVAALSHEALFGSAIRWEQEVVGELFRSRIAVKRSPRVEHFAYAIQDRELVEGNHVIGWVTYHGEYERLAT